MLELEGSIWIKCASMGFTVNNKHQVAMTCVRLLQHNGSLGVHPTVMDDCLHGALERRPKCAFPMGHVHAAVPTTCIMCFLAHGPGCSQGCERSKLMVGPFLGKAMANKQHFWVQVRVQKMQVRWCRCKAHVSCPETIKSKRKKKGGNAAMCSCDAQCSGQPAQCSGALARARVAQSTPT